MTTDQDQFDKILEKVEELKKNKTVDLSTEEDLAVGIMNLVSLEEHFAFTGMKTAKDGYFDLVTEVREVRKSLLGRLVSQHEGETWCVSKHLLATVMRLIEVGTKLKADGKTDLAKETFAHAHRLWSIFWALRLKLVDTKELKEAAPAFAKAAAGKGRKPWSLEEIMDKMVDCCDE